MIIVKQYTGDVLFRKFNVKDAKKIEFWKRMSQLPFSGIVTKVIEVK